jgi:hypothetical protein
MFLQADQELTQVPFMPERRVPPVLKDLSTGVLRQARSKYRHNVCVWRVHH